MSKRQHQPLSVSRLLHQQQFANIEQQLQRKNALGEHGENILKNLQLEACKAVSMRDGVIRIEAPSGAWLNRLKQLRGAILSAFRSAIPSVISVDFAVNPQLNRIKAEAPEKSTSKATMSPASAKHITEIANSLSGELAEKMRKLAALCGEK